MWCNAVSKPPFLISNRTGPELWQKTTQLPTVTTIETEGIGSTDEEREAAHKYARRLIDENSGLIKQYFLRMRGSSDLGVSKYVHHSSKLAPGITATYDRNFERERLQVRASARASISVSEGTSPTAPLLVTSGWVVFLSDGWINLNSRIDIADPDFLEVRFENSANCGGPNNLIQKVSLSQKLTAVRGNWEIEITDYEGRSERENANFERFYVQYVETDPAEIGIEIPYTPVLFAQSVGEDLQCEMGPSDFVVGDDPVFRLDEGKSAYIWVHATTGDTLYHVNAYYRITWKKTYVGTTPKA